MVDENANRNIVGAVTQTGAVSTSRSGVRYAECETAGAQGPDTGSAHGVRRIHEHCTGRPARWWRYRWWRRWWQWRGGGWRADSSIRNGYGGKQFLPK